MKGSVFRREERNTDYGVREFEKRQVRKSSSMCIAAWIWQAHPLYPLVLLLNRDEFHDRYSWKSPLEFAEELVMEARDYNGFNLILADIPSKLMVWVPDRSTLFFFHVCDYSQIDHLKLNLVIAKQGQFGTRSTAALSVKTDGNSRFYEKYLEKGVWKDHAVSYNIEKMQ
ncbi:hypothetical protein B296_00046035 [Ensete ventricosum]|uniref:Uncharacterized protein n=1 Tax=Ensete ventricosum TaxID=4639 RepID=A0A426Z5H2_ENSVE|nr:hypothetical protein B296_00046035 [Ensete ventricosum]